MSDHGIGGFPKGAGCVGCGESIPKLCVSRIYYFLTFATLGTLWMLLTTFFRYLGLSATQAGIVAGARPLMSGVSVAIWMHVADRFQWSKRPVLLLAVTSHCLLSVAMVFFKPQFAATETSVCGNASVASLRNASHITAFPYDATLPVGGASVVVPIVAVTTATANASLNDAWSPNCSVVVARSPLPTSVRYGALRLSLAQTFGVLLALVLANEALGSTVTALADVATYSHLGRDNYVQFGWIRVFGAGGWALGVFALTMTAQYFDPDRDSRAAADDNDARLYLSGNYELVFLALAALLALSFVAGALFQFAEQPRGAARLALRNTLAQVLTARMALLAVVALQAGAALGLTLSFLFWRVQDVGGRQVAMGAASLVAALGDVPAYLLAPAAIRRLGAERVVLLGAACQVVYLVGVGTATRPWTVVLFQPLMGGMHGLLWAALQAIVVPMSVAGTEAAMIGVLHTLVYGFGAGAGSLVGGALIDALGSRRAFLCVAAASAAVLCLHGASVRHFGSARPSPPEDDDGDGDGGGTGVRALVASPPADAAAEEEESDSGHEYTSLFATAEHDMPGARKYRGGR